MKNFAIFVLAITLLCKVQSRSLASGAKTSEPGNAALIGIPKLAQLSSPVAPGVDKTTCGGLWGKEGYLCSKEKLLKADSEIIKDLDKKYAKYTHFLDMLEGINNWTQKATNVKPDVKGDLAKLVDRTKVSLMKKNAKSCLEKTNEARKSSYCSRCSGAYARYILNATNAQYFITDQGFCSEVYKECADSIREYIEVFQAIANSSGPIFKIFKANKISIYATPGTNPSRLIKYVTELMDLKPLLQNDKSVKHEAIVCSFVLKIKGSPTFMNLLNLFEKPVTQFHRAIYGSESRILSRMSNWRSLQGILQATTEPDRLFAPGDIAIMKGTDNVFTAFDGMKGTTLHAENGHLKAMNLSLSLP